MFLYNCTWGDTVSSGEAIRFKYESEKRIHFRIKNGRQQVSFHVYLYERQTVFVPLLWLSLRTLRDKLQ